MPETHPPTPATLPPAGIDGRLVTASDEIIELNGAGPGRPLRLRLRVALRRLGGPLEDFEFERKEPRVPFRELILQPLQAFLIIAVFLFLCSGLISRFITPLNADEIDTDWLFCMNQYYANKGTPPKGAAAQDVSPFGLGAAHSGMHNLTFWLRVWPYDKYDWVRRHFDVWNRVYNMIATFFMLAMVYGFSRWALGHTYAIIALFIATFMQYTYLLTIEGNYMNETSAAYLASIWAFMAGERAKRWPVRLILGVAAGLFASLTWLLYFSGRLVVVGLLGYCLVRYVMNRRWLRHAMPLLIGLFAVYGPAFREFKKGMDAHPELVEYRQTGTQLLYLPQLNQQLEGFKTNSVFVLVYKNVRLAFESFYKHMNNYHSYAASGYVDMLSAVFLGVGFLFMVFRWRHPFFLMILLLFLMNNAVLGGLTMLPNPPYHQRVHFGILLAAFIIAVPLWHMTRLPRRWGEMGAWCAAILAFAIAVINSNKFMEREFGGKDPYMKTTLRTSIMGTYIETLVRNYEVVVYNEGVTHIAFDSQWGSFNPIMRIPDARVGALVTWRTRPNFDRAELPGKRLIFLVQQPNTAYVEGEIATKLPGGQWITMRDDFDEVFFHAYVPPLPPDQRPH